MAELVTPRACLRSSFLAALLEYHEDGMHPELDETALAAPGEFARYVGGTCRRRRDSGRTRPLRRAAVRRGGARAEGGRLRAADHPLVGRGRGVPGAPEHPPPSDAELLYEGGNIGYEVRPGARRQGHATAMLAAALPIAARARHR